MKVKMKMKKYIFLIAIFLLGNLGFTQASISPEFKEKVAEIEKTIQVAQTNQLDPVAVNSKLVWSKDKTQIAIISRVDILDGWHIYAYVPQNQPFIQTELSLDKMNGLKPVNDWSTPTAFPYVDGIYIYKNQLTFTRYFNVDEKFKKQDELTFELYYQTCDANKCYPPQSKTVNLPVIPTASDDGIQFEKGSFEEALAKAKSSNKIVFMDCYTVWCGPCKKMDKEVFTQKEVGDYFNQHFVSVKMDMEKGEGIDLARKYKVKAFPTLLFLDPEGNVLHTRVGGANVEEFLEDGKIANDPSKQLGRLSELYEKGNRELKFMAQYIKALYSGYQLEKVREIGKAYIPSMTNDQYASTAGFTILAYSGIDYKGRIYNYMIDNKSIFIEAEGIGQESFDYVISSSINAHMTAVANTESLEQLKEEIQKSRADFTSPGQKQLETTWINQYYLANKEFEKWFDANEKAGNDLLETDEQMALSTWVNTAYRVVADPIFKENEVLKQRSIDLMERSLKIDDTMLAAYYCLGALYKSTGDKEKALHNINTFIKKGKEKDIPDDPRVIKLKEEIEAM